MDENKRKRPRVETIVCLAIGLAGLAAAVSPTIETVLNWAVGLPVAAVAGLSLVVLFAREAWHWVVVQWEIRRPIRRRGRGA